MSLRLALLNGVLRHDFLALVLPNSWQHVDYVDRFL